MEKLKLNLDELKVESFELLPQQSNQQGTVYGQVPQTQAPAATCSQSCNETCNTCNGNTCLGSCVNTCGATCAATCAESCAATCTVTCSYSCGACHTKPLTLQVCCPTGAQICLV